MPINIPALAARALDVVAHQTISVSQRSGSYANGLWTSGAAVVVSALATVTPAKGNDLLRLPENRRNEESIRVITAQILSAGDRTGSREADRVTWNGRVYECEHVQRWDGSFYDAICVLVGQ